MRTVTPSSTDWLGSADFNSGTVLVEGRLAELLYPELWRDCVGAWSHALDPRPWDYSGNGNHGVRVGVSDPPNNSWGLTAASLHRIAVTDRASLDFGTSVLFSGEAWLRTATDANQSIFGKMDQSTVAAAARGFQFLYNATINALRLSLYNGASAFTTYDGSTNLHDGGWHHVAFTVSVRQATPGADDAEIYADGAAEGTLNVANIGTNTDMTNALDLQLGSVLITGALGAYFNGDLTDLMLHRRALSAQEVAQLAERQGLAYECRLLPKVFDLKAEV